MKFKKDTQENSLKISNFVNENTLELKKKFEELLLKSNIPELESEKLRFYDIIGMLLGCFISNIIVSFDFDEDNRKIFTEMIFYSVIEFFNKYDKIVNECSIH